MAVMLCPGTDRRVAPPILGALALVVLGAGRLSLIFAGCAALAAGWNKCHDLAGWCWPSVGKVTGAELVNAMSFGVVAALVFLTCSVLARGEHALGHNFQSSKATRRQSRPIGHYFKEVYDG